MTTTPENTPVVVTLVDDGDLAVAGLHAMLAPYADRVCLLDTRAALANPRRLDVILYEPIGQSAMGHSLLRDLSAGGEARAAVLSWAGPDQLPQRPTSPCLSKMLTASQLVVALEKLAAQRGDDAEPDELADAVPLNAMNTQVAEVAEIGGPRMSIAGGAGSEDGPDDELRRRIDDDLPVPLTPRELDVLERIVGGLSNREISADLELSLNSVKTYVRSAYRKIGVIRRTQAVLWGVGRGMGDLGRDDRVAG